MTSAQSKLLMLGLRGSGKTSYLAALWHYLESAEVTDRLYIAQLQPDRDYLNSVRNNWLSLKPIGRTPMRGNVTATLFVGDRATNSQIEVSLPDLSGESFRLQWETRKATKSYVDQAKDCSAIFLFVHPGDIRNTHAIKASPETNESHASAPASPRIDHRSNWTAEQSSTQVQLVEILQILNWIRDIKDHLRISIVVSAWDTIRSSITPDAWFERRLPLLSQFLQANQDWLESEVFGVSAQGGDLVSDKERLMDFSTASSRCIAVKGSSRERVSISAPLQFLLDGHATN